MHERSEMADEMTKELGFPVDYLLSRQLRWGMDAYRNIVLTISIVRIVIVVVIWSVLASYFSSAAPIALVTLALIVYTLVETYSAVIRMKTAHWAIMTIDREWHDAH